MKNLVDCINESKTTRLPISFDLYPDIDNVLGDLMWQYELKGKYIEKEDIEKAFAWFLEKKFL